MCVYCRRAGNCERRNKKEDRSRGEWNRWTVEEKRTRRTHKEIDFLRTCTLGVINSRSHFLLQQNESYRQINQLISCFSQSNLSNRIWIVKMHDNLNVNFVEKEGIIHRFFFGWIPPQNLKENERLERYQNDFFYYLFFEWNSGSRLRRNYSQLFLCNQNIFKHKSFRFKLDLDNEKRVIEYNWYSEENRSSDHNSQRSFNWNLFWLQIYSIMQHFSFIVIARMEKVHRILLCQQRKFHWSNLRSVGI